MHSNNFGRRLKMKRIVVFLGCVLICFGCATAQTSNYVPATPYAANFNYTPSPNESGQSVDVVFAVGKVEYKYAGKTAWLSTPQFFNFEKALNEDIPEILTSKGFTVRGSFDSYDLIPYSDKKTIDLYLLPTVTISVMIPEELAQLKTKVVSKIILESREIITRELMWSKSIPFAEFDAEFTSVVASYTAQHGKITNVTFQYLALENYMARELEKQYPVVMDTIHKLIDPEEMTIIKNQAKEIKSKKGY
jgi:hypothetical protein